MITLFPTHESSFFRTLRDLISGVLLPLRHMGKLSPRRRRLLPKVFERERKAVPEPLAFRMCW